MQKQIYLYWSILAIRAVRISAKDVSKVAFSFGRLYKHRQKEESVRAYIQESQNNNNKPNKVEIDLSNFETSRYKRCRNDRLRAFFLSFKRV